jgi:8-oxo-dGTP pyrophosphatase MutT (NUDIX family)
MRRRVGVAGIIPRGRTVLVLRRSRTDGFLPGAYDLPGGGLDPAESPEEGVKREVLEETGLHTSIVRRLGSRSYLLDPDSGEQDKTMVVFLLRVEHEGLRITLSEEHDEYRWVSDSDLGGIFGSDDLMRSVIHEYFISDSSL